MSEKEYRTIQAVCRNVCRDESLVNDLTQEVALIFLELPRDKQKKIRAYFQFWVVRVVTNQWKSTTSPFYTQYRNAYYIEDTPISEEEPTQDFAFPQEQEESVAKLVSELYLSDQNVVRDYYEKGLTIMEITEKYGVEKTYVWTVLNRIRQSFKRRISWQITPPNTMAFIEIIAPFIGRPRLKIEERQLILDVYNHINKSTVNAVHDREVTKVILERLVKRLQL